MTDEPQEITFSHSLRDSDISQLVFLVGGVRSGTTVLRTMMATHPEIVDRDEIFNAEKPRCFYRYMREQVIRQPDLVFPEYLRKLFASYLASLVPGNDDIAVMDVKYEHLNLITKAWQLPFTDPVILDLMRRRGFKVVHLRRNHFYSVVSDLVAVQTGRYRTPLEDGSALPEKKRVSADREIVLATMKERKRTAELVDSWFGRDQCLTLDYESIFDTGGDFAAATVEKIAAFLGVPDKFERVPVLQKIIDEPLSRIVINYDEIRDLEMLAI